MPKAIFRKIRLAVLGLCLIAVTACTGSPFEGLNPDNPDVASEPPTATTVAEAPSATAETVAQAPATPTTALQPGEIVHYRVQEGDNLSIIAAKFDSSVAAIVARNHIADPNLLYVGTVLEIMVGEKTPPQEPPTATSAPQAPPPTATRAVAQSAPPTAPPAASPTQRKLNQPAVTPVTVPLEPTRPVQPASAYEVYIPTASKSGQDFHYTCEFDAAWALFKTYGIDTTLQEQLQIIGVDTSVEPYWEDTPNGVIIHGGDIGNYYSGDYANNFLARATGSAMRKVFQHYGLRATPVHDQAAIEEALRAGSLVWIKTTVDFKRWVPATWLGPDGRTYPTVLGNDHAVVVAGFNANVAVIRDVLGPTSTNANRLLEYEVPWPTFMLAWGAQDFDGLAVAPPR